MKELSKDSMMQKKKLGKAMQYGKIQREIFIPMIVLFYNFYMSAIDLFHQYWSYIKL